MWSYYPRGELLKAGRSRYRLALVRTLSPQIVVAGQPARLNLTLTNEGKTPSGALLLEDHVPYVLGTRPRFVLDGIGQGWLVSGTVTDDALLMAAHDLASGVQLAGGRLP